MTRATRQLAVFSVVAVALIAAVLWTGRRDYQRDPPALTSFDPAAVTKIELDIPPIAPQVFAQRDGGWWRVKPSQARADDARAQRLANLAASPVARWIPGKDIDPAKVGLDHPSATLVLNGERLEYGGLTAIGDLRYVQVGGKVALVPRQYSPEVMLTKPDTQ
ncbi:MAG: hypothetical protein ACREP2_14165 [Rhodanobacteraceae bacterium]